MAKGYSQYRLTEKSRANLLEKFPPKFKKVIAHHITILFGCEEYDVPFPDSIGVVGYSTNNTSLEALVVEINNSIKSKDNRTYHITWSLEGNMRPKDSNSVITDFGFTPVEKIEINVISEFVKF
jgi:hypothetical protein